MDKEIEFIKYDVRGSDYHYRQIDKLNLKEFNSFVYARLIKQINIIKKIIKNKYNKNCIIKILDVGCGDGVLLFLLNGALKGYNIELYGVDSSEIALKIAKQRVENIKVKQTDVYNLDFFDQYFDLVVSSDVIEHVKYPLQMLDEITRVTKKDSTIIISTPIRYLEKPSDVTHVKEFYPEEFEKMLSQSFNQYQLLKSHSLLYFLLYIKPLKFFSKKILLYRYIINFFTIFFNMNIFLSDCNDYNDPFSYMFAICKK